MDKLKIIHIFTILLKQLPNFYIYIWNGMSPNLETVYVKMLPAEFFLIDSWSIDQHYSNVIMSVMASQITSLTTVYSINRLFRCRSKKTSKLCITGLCVGNSLVTGEFPTQRASNTENVSIWWHHHELIQFDKSGSSHVWWRHHMAAF